MRLINEKLASDLLEAGRQEFLSYGFQGASMRRIAASLGVTTGAIYRYYTDKEALFEAIVEPAAGKLQEMYRQVQQAFSDLPLEGQLGSLPEVTDNESRWMMDFIYDHHDVFKLISCCSAGTAYEYYIDTLIEIEVNSSRMLIDRMKAEGMKVRDIDDELSHIVASALFNGIFEPVRHDMPREKAMQYMQDLRDFYSAGWFRLLGIS